MSFARMGSNVAIPSKLSRQMSNSFRLDIATLKTNKENLTSQWFEKLEVYFSCC